MPGKTNLKEILQNINPRLLDETFVFITSSEPPEDLINSLKPKATFLEDEGITLVINQKDADVHSLQYDSIFKCIKIHNPKSEIFANQITSKDNEYTTILYCPHILHVWHQFYICAFS